MSVFISYAHNERDRALATVIGQVLRSYGRKRVYWDIDLPPGIHWSPALEHGIDKSRYFIILLSPNALHSGWVEAELQRAHNQSRTRALTIIPICVDMDPAAIPLKWAACVAGIQCLRWTRNDGVEKLLNSLLAVVGKPRLPKREEAKIVEQIASNPLQAPHLTSGSGPDFGRELKHALIAWNAGRAAKLLGRTLLLAAILGSVTLFAATAPAMVRDIIHGIDDMFITIQDGVDKQNRKARYTIIVVSREYYWQFGQSIAVIDSQGTSVPIEDKLAAAGIADTIRQLQDVIGVGLASCVGAARDEELRAAERASMLVAWLREVRTPLELHLYSLNLGQYMGSCDAPDRDQRIVLIVGVTEKDEGVNLEESFRDALYKARRRVFRAVDVQRYSHWPQDKFAASFVLER